MKHTLFIMTHIGSGWEKLKQKLEEDCRVHVFKTGFTYNHPDDVGQLTKQLHRRDNSASIWADVIFFNKDFTLKRLCNFYHFIFWSSSFAFAQDELLKYYATKQAGDYWAYRMAGLKQYYLRASGSLWNPKLDQPDLLLNAIL